MNENGGKKRREWVKNAAIIFLSVMLVLTFFSNTFMNYSLPEVAAQYVQSGTITAKIRGTGTVESGDPYNVKISETRTISSVLVKTGDKVEKGDPLFLLEDKESKELTDAQAALDKAMLDFELALLSGNISNSTVDGLSQYVEQSTQCLITYRHLNSFSGSNDIHILAKSFTGTQHDAANGIVANMLCHFHDQTLAFTVYFQGILDKGKIIVLELYVYNRSHDLDDLTMIFFLYVTQLFRTSFLAFFFFF